MRMFSARGLGIVCGVAVGMGVASANAATLSLRAMKINDVEITPTNNRTVAPNDLVEAGIFISGWGAELPRGIRIVQAAVFGRAGFLSGENGVALPVGWEAPIESIGNPCTINANCVDPRYPVCRVSSGICASATHNPDLGSFIDRNRTDFIHFQLDGIFQISNVNPNYSYVCLADGATTIDTGVPRYVGTLKMRMTPNACGVFTINFLGGGTSFIADDRAEPIPVLPAFQPLVLTVSPCALQMRECDPDHCTIDPRQPHPLTAPIPRATINRFVAHFSGPTAGLLPSSFTLTQIPLIPGESLPQVQTVTPNGNLADIVLSRSINFPAYTCIKHNSSSRQCCFGVLPGDVDASNFVQPLDAFGIIENLEGQITPALGLERCDLDRSNLCTSADLLRFGDLLNGAQSFAPGYNNATLQACPDDLVR